jgi:hypothetical protein
MVVIELKVSSNLTDCVPISFGAVSSVRHLCSQLDLLGPAELAGAFHGPDYVDLAASA